MSTLVAVLTVPERTPRPIHTVTVSARQRQPISRNEVTQILQREKGKAAKLPRATGVPSALAPAAAAAPPLKPEGEFGFAPYWTLDQATTFDVAELSTIAYFSLDVNSDGTISQSGTGWDGYQSQAFADLVNRAHGAGDRVVLTVSCFSQPALDALTSSPAAATTLARGVVADIAAKHLDGVNLDLEGVGPTDQAGLTALVSTVAQAVRAFDPHDQVTMDTYASSAGDPRGFFDIPALSHVVDGFFVMDYDLNFDGAPTQGSPLTSVEFPDALAAAQYAAAVPSRMVILGASFFGYEWPTSNGTLDASASGPSSPVSYTQAVSSGPLYWDRVTQTAWSSFERGGQWYETYFEDPESIYLLSELARHYGFGTGVWALGMEGGDPRMLAAADDVTPGTGTGPTGPSWTPSSKTRSPALAAGASSGSGPGKGGHSTGKKSAGRSSSAATTAAPPTTTASTTTTTTVPEPQSTTTTAPPPTTTTGSTAYQYSGVVDSRTVALEKVADSAVPSGTPALVGTVSTFRTNDPAMACLEKTPAPMDVWKYAGSADDFATARAPNCATATFEFPASDIPTQAMSL